MSMNSAPAVKYRYYTCDVFTKSRFGGNQLAVLPEAAGLSDRQMQQIAREFNYSETTFVFPPEHGKTRRVRIFTPAREVPFAGHPNIGTAFVLASIGEFGVFQGNLTVVFEEGAGVVPVTIQAAQEDGLWCELVAPQGLTLGKSITAELAALLSHHNPALTGDYSWRIAQGVEMGRPSILEASTRKRDGVVTATRIGGNCVMVSEGAIAVDQSDD